MTNPYNETPLTRLLENGYRFDTVLYFKNGWALLKQFVGGFILFTLAILIGLRIVEELPNYLGTFLQLSFAVCWAGYFWVCHRLARGEKPALSDFLVGFKQWKWLLPLSIAALCPLIIGLLAAIYLPLPLGLLAIGVALLCIAFFLFALPLAIIFQLSTLEALSMSAKLVKKNIPSIAFFFLLLVSMNLLAIPTIIAVPLTIPLSACAIYCALTDMLKQ